MGIDFVVDLPCVAKRTLGTQGLVDLVKARSRADAVLQIARQNGDLRPAEQITFKIALMTPAGVQERDARISELYAQAAALDPHRAACSSCPANGGAPGFGCYRTIAYPIPARVESFLLARLPAIASCTAGQMLRRAFSDFGWDGAHAANMRTQGQRFFEASVPEARRFDDGFALTADQVHHMMFNVGHPNATHAMMLALFFGVIPHDLDPGWLATPQNRAHVLAYATVAPQQDGATEAMAQYLRACALAARLDATILVDG